MPVAGVYWAVLRVRHVIYDVGILPSFSFDVPVVGVGNLSFGGTGKSSFVLWLVKRLRARGVSVGIVSHGYRKRGAEPVVVSEDMEPEEAGDEALMLRILGGVPVVSGRNRLEAIPLLLGAHPELSLLVMDDALQYRSVIPQLMFVLTCAEKPYWRDWLFPVGGLRDVRGRAQAADVVVVIGNDESRVQGVDFQPRNGQVMVRGWWHYRGVRLVSGTHAEHEKFVAVAGVGNFWAFREGVARLGVEVVECVGLSDHVRYNARRVEQLLIKARQAGATAILTTWKDWVKLCKFVQGRGEPAVYVVERELVFPPADEWEILRRVEELVFYA